MLENDKTLENLVQKIVELVNPLEIILFGSRARGDNSKDSDYDLMVVMPEGTHRRDTARYLYRYLVPRNFPLDIVIATTRDLAKHKDNIGLIYYYILKEGKRIYAIQQ